MWFIFPQIAGLGRSPTSVLYAISSLDEAKALHDEGVDVMLIPGRLRQDS